MAPQVSVVVATYRSGPGLDRLVESLEAQSLAPGDLELIAVDDGSGDGTLERLTALAATRPWMRVSAVPHSGWPCAPRNAGLELAEGEYVLFADHDDVLYPESLERASAFARKNQADVLNGKEVRTHSWWWGMSAFRQDVPVNEPGDVAALLPMTPHKLYRRQFLLDHGIRFIEGARVLWEDVYFNIDVFTHHPRVATLSSYPMYHWVATGANSSSTFDRDPAEQWSHLRRVMTHVREAGLDADSRDWLLGHWYRTRVLGWIGPGLLSRPAAVTAIGLPLLEGLVEDLVPERLDAALGPMDRGRADLLRAGRTDLLHQLAEADRGITLVPRVRDVSVTDGRVSVLAEGVLERDGVPLELRRHGDRIQRLLPPEIARVVSSTALDVSGWAEPRVDMCARGRASRVPWVLPTAAEAELEAAAPDTAHLRVTARGVLDLDHALFGRPLDEQMWDFGLRVDLGGPAPSRLLSSTGFPDLLLPRRDEVAVFYDNAGGLLSLDRDGSKRGLVASSRLVPPRTSGVVGDPVQIDLEGTAVAGPRPAPAEVLVGDRTVAAEVVRTDSGTALRFVLPDVAGGEQLSVRLAGRTRTTQLSTSVSRRRVRLVVTPPDGSAQSPAPRRVTEGWVAVVRGSLLARGLVPARRELGRVLRLLRARYRHRSGALHTAWARQPPRRGASVMRYVVSDVHGHREELVEALRSAGLLDAAGTLERRRRHVVGPG